MKRTICLIGGSLICALVAVKAWPQDSPPEGFFPPNMPNQATLYLRFCLVGNHVCRSYRALVWGQTCDAGLAKDESEDSDKIDGTVPPGFHYAGWYCETFDGHRFDSAHLPIQGCYRSDGAVIRPINDRCPSGLKPIR